MAGEELIFPVQAKPPAAPPSLSGRREGLEFPVKAPALAASYLDTSPLDPDRAARVMGLSKKMRQPESFVDRNLDKIEVAAGSPSDAYWADFERRNPGTARFLVERRNMAVAKDDVESLSFWERVGTDWSEGLRRGNLQVQIAQLSEAQRRGGPQSLEYERDILAMEDELGGIGDRGGVVRRFAEQIPNMIFSSKKGLERGAPLAVMGAGAGVAGGPAAAVTVPAGAALGMSLGGGLGYFEAARTLEGELAFREFVNARDENGNSMPREIAAKYADMVGAVNGTIEATADLLLTKFVGGPVLRAGGGVAARLAARVPGAARLLGVIDENPRVFAGMTLGGAIRRAALTLAKAEASEISTEVTQEIVSGAAGEGAKRSSGQPFEKQGAGDVLSRSAGVIVPTFQATLIPGLLGGGSGLYVDVDQVRRANQAKALYTAMGENAEASKLRKRLPESHRSFVEERTKGGAVENISIPVDDFDAYFQSKNLDVAQAAQELGVADLDKLREAGEDITVPLATWVEKVAGSEHYQGLADDIKFSPDDLTVRQLRAREETISRLMDEEADRLAGESDAVQTSRDAVYEDVRRQVLGAGRPEAEAKAAARVWASRAVVEARRRGITPEEWYQGGGLRVEGEGSAGRGSSGSPSPAGSRSGPISPSQAGIEVSSGPRIPGSRRGGTSPNTLFPSLQASSLTSITQSPDMVKLSEDVAAVVDKYAGERGVEATPEFAKALWQELHDAIDKNKRATLAKDKEAMARIKAEYPDLGSEWMTVNSHRWVMGQVEAGEETGYFQKHVAGGHMAAFRPRAALAAEGRSLNQGPARLGDFSLSTAGRERVRELVRGYFFQPDTGLTAEEAVEYSHLEDDGVLSRTQAQALVEALSRFKTDLDSYDLAAMQAFDQAGLDQYSGAVESIANGVADLLQRKPPEGMSLLGGPGAGNVFFQSAAGEFEVQRDVALPKSVKAVALEAAPADRDGAVVEARERFQGKSIKNEHTGWEISVARAGINKASSGAGDVHFAVLRSLDEVIRWAVYLRRDVDREGRRQVKAWHYLYAPVETGGKTHLAKIAVREMEDGRRYYDHAVVETERPAGYLASGPGEGANVAPAAGPSTVSIQDLLGLVKAQRVRDTFFQDPGDPRAFIQFTPQETLIKLARSADASSFMHESAHAWLEDIWLHVRSGRADEAYMAWWRPMSTWLGVKEGQEKIETVQHEQFARAFEAYLREGKSPSRDLAPAFRLFRRWLARIYRHVASLDVELTDDVRGFFDRMVAAEDAVSDAEGRMAYGVDFGLKGFSPEILGRVEKLRAAAHEEAVTTLLRRQMKELTAEHREALTEERRKAEFDARDRAEHLPEYQAIAEIERAFRDSSAGRDVPRAPKVDARDIAREYVGGELQGPEREAFDLLAESHGYGSGDEMAKAVIATRPIDDEVTASVELRMSEFADLKDRGAIREEALQAVHNEFREELTSLEHSIFLGKVNDAIEGAGEKFWKRRSAKIESDIARRRAAEIIASRPVQYAGSYMRYFTAERNAAVEAARALLDGQYQKAAGLKRRQMLNHALAMESLRARKEIERAEKFLGKFGGRGTELKGLPFGFVNQVDRLLSDYGLAPARDWDMSLAHTAREMREAGDDRQAIANATGMVWDGARWQRETLVDLVQRMQDDYLSPAVPESILSGRPIDYKKMSLAQFRDLRTAVEALVNVGRNYDRFMTERIKEDVQTAALALRTAAEANVGTPYEERRALGHKDSEFLERWEELTSRPGDRLLGLTNILTIFRYLDGGKDDGPWQNIVYRTLTGAENVKLRWVREATEGINKLMSESFTAKEFAALRRERVHFDFLNEKKPYLTREEMIAVALNYGNEGNRNRLLLGYGLDDVQAGKIVNALTKKEMDFIQGVWDHLETYWPKILELEMRVSGVQPKKVKAMSIVTRHGTYRGGYYPIAYDYKKSAEALKHAEQLNALYKQFGAVSAHTRHGHTQARVDSLGRPLKLSLDVFFGHVENVVHDLSFRAAVIDVNRLLRQKDVREAVANAMGPAGMREIEGALKALASDQGEYLGALEKAVRWVRFGATISRLGLRPVRIPGDLAVNLWLGGQEIGAKRLTRAMSSFAMNRRETVDFVNGRSERMRNRAALRDRDLSDLNSKWKGDSTAKNLFFITMSLADETVSYPLWKEVYEHNLMRGVETAAQVADEAVTRTFGSGSVLDQASIQRGNEWQKTVTWFYSWCGMMFNRAWLQGRLAGLAYDKKNFGQAAQVAGAAIFSMWILPGLIEGVFMEFFRNAEDRDDDGWKKRLAARIIGQGFGYVPGVRDVVGYGIDRALGLYASMETPLQGTLRDYVDPLADLVKASSPDYDLPDNFWEKAARAGSLAAGIPQQFNAWLFNFIDWMRDEGEPTWRDLLSRRQRR